MMLRKNERISNAVRDCWQTFITQKLTAEEAVDTMVYLEYRLKKLRESVIVRDGDWEEGATPVPQ